VDKFLYIDYLLEITRQHLIEADNISLPNRFESAFFFETLEDCINYRLDFLVQLGNKVIEVELQNLENIYRFDNQYISSFQKHDTAYDYIDKISKYLRGQMSTHPLIEVVYYGDFKVVSQRILK
jgi:hypothetical protein